MVCFSACARSRTSWLARYSDFYSLVSNTAISHNSAVAPLVRQSFPPRRQETAVPERELVAGD